MSAQFELRSTRPLPGAIRQHDGTYARLWSGCAVVGILNATPDSFSDGGLHFGTAQAVDHALAMADAGAFMVDVGGESTRPGGDPVPAERELERVLPIIEAVASRSDVLLSVDTYKASVAAAAIKAGAHVVNDVSGLADPDMAHTCGSLGVPMVLMHMRGTPKTMQIDPQYDDVVSEVTAHLRQRRAIALQAGVPTVVVDPGIGFGKNLQHNLAILRSMPIRDADGAALQTMVGASRKRSIGDLSGVTEAALRDAGSIALHLDCARRGVAMVRVHDVAGHVQALAVQRGLLES